MLFHSARRMPETKAEVTQMDQGVNAINLANIGALTSLTHPRPA